MVGVDPIQFRATTENEALAFDQALAVALDHRGDMGYPWIDREVHSLKLRVASEDGQAAAEAFASSVSRDFPFSVEIIQEKTAIAQLDVVSDAVTRLREAGVPGAGLIWMTEPDQRDNRVVISVERAEPAILTELAERYGTDRIAVRVRASGAVSTAGRDSDSPSFWGGAYITTSAGLACTSGFAWNVAGASAMLTAAHCISTGGTISYPGYSNVGTVSSGGEENWSTSNGTQYYSGQSVYRGDVALARYSSNTAAYIYSGAPHTSTYSGVAAMNSRWAQFGDAVCVNGVVNGEWCGMVTATGGNAWYLVNGVNVWARHVNMAEAVGPNCPQHGDSGAPVFQKRADGKVTAFGIFSGFVPLVAECAVYFTDIRDSYLGLPRTLKITG